jgi:hypothetical protein
MEKCYTCNNFRIVNEDLKGKLSACLVDRMEIKANLKAMLDEEIAFAKQCHMPQFVLGLQQAKKIIDEGFNI